MPAYIRFIQDGIPIRGSVSSGLHMGWSQLLSFKPGGPSLDRERGVPTISEIVVVKPFQAAQDSRFWRSRSGHLFDQPSDTSSNLTAEVDFTIVDGRGREKTVLRTMLHGVRIVSLQPLSRG